MKQNRIEAIRINGEEKAVRLGGGGNEVIKGRESESKVEGQKKKRDHSKI